MVAGTLTSGTIAMTGWQLEEGSTATPFEHRPYGLELELCQRYYEVGKEPYLYMGGLSGLSAAYDSIYYLVAKRVSPTVVMSGWQYFSGGTSTPFTPVIGTSDTSFFGFVGSGFTNWSGWSAAGTWTASAEL